MCESAGMSRIYAVSMSIDASELTRQGFRALNAVVKPTVRAGVANPWPLGGGLVLLETLGRKSGEWRSVPLVSSRAGDTVVVSTVRSNSLWLKNIEADNRVGVWLNGSRRTGTAMVTRGPLNTAVIRLD